MFGTSKNLKNFWGALQFGMGPEQRITCTCTPPRSSTAFILFISNNILIDCSLTWSVGTTQSTINHNMWHWTWRATVRKHPDNLVIPVPQQAQAPQHPQPHPRLRLLRQAQLQQWPHQPLVRLLLQSQVLEQRSKQPLMPQSPWQQVQQDPELHIQEEMLHVITMAIWQTLAHVYVIQTGTWLLIVQIAWVREKRYECRLMLKIKAGQSSPNATKACAGHLGGNFIQTQNLRRCI